MYSHQSVTLRSNCDILLITLIVLCLFFVIAIHVKCNSGPGWVEKHIGQVKSYEKMSNKKWIIFSDKNIGVVIKDCGCSNPADYFILKEDMILMTKGKRIKLKITQSRTFNVIEIL